MKDLKTILESKPRVKDFDCQPYGYINALQNYIDKLEKAINYNQCSLQLKGKKVLSFTEWKMIKFAYNNGLYNDLVDRRKFYTQAQVLKKYNSEILNL